MKKYIKPGDKYHRWTVISKDEQKTIRTKWICLCDCGNKKLVQSNHLTSGASKSCGCLLAQKNIELRQTHGLSKSRIYRIWRNMINRCHYEKYAERHLYGGRGIIVCDRWRYSFENFLLDMGIPDDCMSIDRIDVDGNYEPSNCKWSTAKEQAANRRKRK